MAEITCSLENNLVITTIQTSKCPRWCINNVAEILMLSKNNKYVENKPRSMVRCNYCGVGGSTYFIRGFNILFHLCQVCKKSVSCLDIRKIGKNIYESCDVIDHFEFDLTIDLDKKIINIQSREPFAAFSRLPYLLADKRNGPDIDQYISPIRDFIVKLAIEYTMLLYEIINVGDITIIIMRYYYETFYFNVINIVS